MERDVPESKLEPDLIRFLQTHIPTVEHLEILLLLSSSADHWWTVRAVNDLLRSSEQSIGSRCRELCVEGLLDEASEGGYRLKENVELAALVNRLKTAYREFRVRVVETIYGPKGSAISEFSRAFDFKKREE